MTVDVDKVSNDLVSKLEKFYNGYSEIFPKIDSFEDLPKDPVLADKFMKSLANKVYLLLHKFEPELTESYKFEEWVDDDSEIPSELSAIYLKNAENGGELPIILLHPSRFEACFTHTWGVAEKILSQGRNV